MLFENNIQVDRINDQVCHSKFRKKKEEAVLLRIQLEVHLTWEHGAHVLYDRSVCDSHQILKTASVWFSN